MKPPASLSIDLDNQWAYMRTAGMSGWTDYPSCLDLVIPRMLSCLEARRLRLTAFVVGKDASLAADRHLLESITAAGHEVGNHSFRHEAWLHLYSPNDMKEELDRAEEAIEGVTGSCPRGFRGPGYSLARSTLEALAERGYDYDASSLPTFIGPLARAWYLRSSQLGPEERERLGGLFGDFRDALRPNCPYTWALGDHDLLEIPVTTMPWLRVPIHLSYVLWLGSLSIRLARRYFELALRLCRRAGCPPSVLLHSLDFVDRRDVPELSFFPGMSLARQAKLELIDWSLARLSEAFEVRTMGEHARWLGTAPLPRISSETSSHAGQVGERSTSGTKSLWGPVRDASRLPQAQSQTGAEPPGCSPAARRAVAQGPTRVARPSEAARVHTGAGRATPAQPHQPNEASPRSVS